MLRPVLEEASRRLGRSARAARPDPRPRHHAGGGRAGARPARPLGPHLRAGRPDAVAVGRRAPADDRHEPRRTPAPSARSCSASPATTSPGSASGSASRTPTVPPAGSPRRPQTHGFPLFEVPYETPFIAVTEKAFSHLVNEQYALLQRALSAHERLERVVLSEQRPGRRHRRARRSDRRHRRWSSTPAGRSLARSDGAVPLTPEVLAATGAEVRERARAGARAATRPPASRTAARSPCRWSAPPPARTATAGAAGVAGRRPGQRRAGGVRPPRASTRPSPSCASSCCAGASPTTPSAGWPATCSPSMVSGELPAPSSRAGLEPFGLRGPRRRARPHAAARRRGARRGRRSAPALRDEGPGGLAARHRAATPARCSRPPAGRTTPTCTRWPSACARACRREAGRALAAGAGRAVAPADPRRDLPRGALRARGRRAGDARETATARAPPCWHPPRPRLLPAPARAAGRRRAAPVLRLHPQPDGADGTAGYCGELLRSLEVFIECNGQWERARASLYCHRHTLRYRIRGWSSYGPLAGLRARSDRLLARAPRARAPRLSGSTPACRSASPPRSRRTSIASR